MASVYKTANGWRAQVRRTGVPTQSAYFPSKQEAQRWAREKEVEHDKRARVPAGLRLTFADVLDEYEKQLKGRRVGTTKLWYLAKQRALLGERRLEELTQDEILSYIRKREREGAGPATALQDLTYLRTALRYGGAALNASGAATLAVAAVTAAQDILTHSGRARASRRRDRRPTADELALLQEYFLDRPRSTTPMMDIVLFAIATTMRLGEIVALQWEDFDEAGRTIKIRDRKDPREKEGNDQVVPLLHGVFTWEGADVDPVAIIKRARSARRRTGRIYPYSRSTIGNAFAFACVECRIENLRFHDLRHDGISRLFEAGYQIPEVALVSGHKSWKNLQRYTQLSPHKIQKVTVKVT